MKKILEGKNREEQTTFTHFRSHYLFESRFCTPGQGHEKGGVESGVGYARRNFLVPMPEVADLAALNQLLLTACQDDDLRTVERTDQTIGERWQREAPHLFPLPQHSFACCIALLGQFHSRFFSLHYAAVSGCDAS